jgi:hypothetical protein
VQLITLFLLTLAPVSAHAWYCQEVASERQGNVINACGIGTGKDENEARTSAFENSKKEFFRICELSTDCAKHEIDVNPQRTSCDSAKGVVTCHRLVTFTVIDKMKGGQAKAIQRITVDRPESFTPFSYESISSLPKIKKGMTKAQVLELFGEPKSAAMGGIDSEGSALFYHSEDFCERSGSVSLCQVYFNARGRVIHFTGFDYKHTEALK